MEQTILKTRFPQVELSYETDAHKKVLNSKYDICVSIPTGKKYFAYFTYAPGTANDACYVIDRQGIQFTQVNYVKGSKSPPLHLETILYGTLCDLPLPLPLNFASGKDGKDGKDGKQDRKFFIIEDVHSYCGLNMKHVTFAEKMMRLKEFLNIVKPCHDGLTFVLPYMRQLTEFADKIDTLLEDPIFYDSMLDKTAYTTHHVQFRASAHIVPHLNHNYKKNTSKTVNTVAPSLLDKQRSLQDLVPRKDIDYAAAARKKEATFLVGADLDDDIYHLHCYGAYFDLAYIGTRKESKYMNGLFRNIRENTNVDLGEESEDEDLFQNVNPDKYVNLEVRIKMNCVYNPRWRRWTPVSVAPDNARIANIKELVLNHGPLDRSRSGQSPSNVPDNSQRPSNKDFQRPSNRPNNNQHFTRPKNRNLSAAHF
jgi:hypothetical protein